MINNFISPCLYC